MKRSYTHIQAVEKEILEMKKAGKTNHEVAEYFGFKDKYIVKRWVSRYNRKSKRIMEGQPLNRRGRPLKTVLSLEQEMASEIKPLKMENELLRNFLLIVGRR